MYLQCQCKPGLKLVLLRLAKKFFGMSKFFPRYYVSTYLLQSVWLFFVTIGLLVVFSQKITQKSKLGKISLVQGLWSPMTRKLSFNSFSGWQLETLTSDFPLSKSEWSPGCFTRIDYHSTYILIYNYLHNEQRKNKNRYDWN